MMRWNYYILEIIRYAFIILFIYAAVSKLIEYTTFYNDLYNSPVFGNKILAGIISWLVPAIELVIAGFLMSNTFRSLGMYLGLILLLMFTFYISGILLFSAHIPCSCGGIISQLSWKEHLLFNIGCIVLAVWGILLLKKKTNISGLYKIAMSLNTNKLV